MSVVRKRRIPWAWVPAAISSAVVVWMRYGPGIAILAVLLGVAMAVYAERKARTRKKHATKP